MKIFSGYPCGCHSEDKAHFQAIRKVLTNQKGPREVVTVSFKPLLLVQPSSDNHLEHGHHYQMYGSSDSNLVRIYLCRLMVLVSITSFQRGEGISEITQQAKFGVGNEDTRNTTAKSHDIIIKPSSLFTSIECTTYKRLSSDDHPSTCCEDHLWEENLHQLLQSCSHDWGSSASVQPHTQRPTISRIYFVW